MGQTRGAIALRFDIVGADILKDNITPVLLEKGIKAAFAIHVLPYEWEAGHSYTVGDVVKPISSGDYSNWQLVSAGNTAITGTSGTTEPTWNRVWRTTVTDNGMVWMCINPGSYYPQVSMDDIKWMLATGAWHVAIHAKYHNYNVVCPVEPFSNKYFKTSNKYAHESYATILDECKDGKDRLAAAGIDTTENILSYNVSSVALRAAQNEAEMTLSAVSNGDFRVLVPQQIAKPLSANFAADATYIQLASGDELVFDTAGYVYVDFECIAYTGVDTTNHRLTGITRGRDASIIASEIELQDYAKSIPYASAHLSGAGVVQFARVKTEILATAGTNHTVAFTATLNVDTANFQIKDYSATDYYIKIGNEIFNTKGQTGKTISITNAASTTAATQPANRVVYASQYLPSGNIGPEKRIGNHIPAGIDYDAPFRIPGIIYNMQDADISTAELKIDASWADVKQAIDCQINNQTFFMGSATFHNVEDPENIDVGQNMCGTIDNLRRVIDYLRANDIEIITHPELVEYMQKPGRMPNNANGYNTFQNQRLVNMQYPACNCDPLTDYCQRFWKPSKSYALGNLCTPTRKPVNYQAHPESDLSGANGFSYVCTGAGTSAATEPVWPTTLNASVADGGATWVAIKIPAGILLPKGGDDAGQQDYLGSGDIKYFPETTDDAPLNDNGEKCAYLRTRKVSSSLVLCATPRRGGRYRLRFKARFNDYTYLTSPINGTTSQPVVSLANKTYNNFVLANGGADSLKCFVEQELFYGNAGFSAGDDPLTFTQAIARPYGGTTKAAHATGALVVPMVCSALVCDVRRQLFVDNNNYINNASYFSKSLSLPGRTATPDIGIDWTEIELNANDINAQGFYLPEGADEIVIGFNLIYEYKSYYANGIDIADIRLERVGDY